MRLQFYLKPEGGPKLLFTVLDDRGRLAYEVRGEYLSIRKPLYPARAGGRDRRTLDGRAPSRNVPLHSDKRRPPLAYLDQAGRRSPGGAVQGSGLALSGKRAYTFVRYCGKAAKRRILRRHDARPLLEWAERLLRHHRFAGSGCCRLLSAQPSRWTAPRSAGARPRFPLDKI